MEAVSLGPLEAANLDPLEVVNLDPLEVVNLDPLEVASLDLQEVPSLQSAPRVRPVAWMYQSWLPWLLLSSLLQSKQLCNLLPLHKLQWEQQTIYCSGFGNKF